MTDFGETLANRSDWFAQPVYTASQLFGPFATRARVLSCVNRNLRQHIFCDTAGKDNSGY